MRPRVWRPTYSTIQQFIGSSVHDFIIDGPTIKEFNISSLAYWFVFTYKVYVSHTNDTIVSFIITYKVYVQHTILQIYTW